MGGVLSIPMSDINYRIYLQGFKAGTLMRTYCLKYPMDTTCRSYIGGGSFVLLAMY